MEYENHLLNGKILSFQTFQYNDDDVRVLPNIIDWADRSTKMRSRKRDRSVVARVRIPSLKPETII